MNRKQKNRLMGAIVFIVLLGIAVGLVLYALKQNINLFYTPTELLKADVQPEQSVRIGGYVKKNSVQFDASGQSVRFVVTDRVNDITVSYFGVLPNLFREGQTVVVTGKINNKILQADQVLAKHDEKYMPRALEKKLKAEERHAA